jgi:hypothetical protein
LPNSFNCRGIYAGKSIRVKTYGVAAEPPVANQGCPVFELADD